MRGIVKLILLWIGSLLYHNQKSKILFYHDVYANHSYKSLDTDVSLGTPICLFKEHIRAVINEGYEIVPQITKSKKQVCIMFDDGFKGVWDNRDFFIENGLKPTVFLAVKLIGEEGFLNIDQILELKNRYGFIFQCHSWNHIDLSQCNDKELEVELKESRKELSRILGCDVNALCLPRGFFSDELLENNAIKEYEEIFSSIPGNYHDLVFGMRTRNLCQFASANEVKLILRGGNELLKKRYLRLHHKHNLRK